MSRGEGGGGQSSVIPEGVMEAVNRSLVNVEELRIHLLEFLSISEPDVLVEMPPLRRAQALLLLAKATLTLFTLRLRCSGVHPDDHPVKTELERLSLYQDKLQRFVDLSKEPLRPSTTLNTRAATRFIEHSLPDLTPEQRQSMRDVSRGEGVRNKFQEKRSAHKKRKFQSSDKQSVQTAAQEFLEKAAREILGENKGDFKGPLRIESSDGEDMPLS
ncbi:PREDICTED: nuclear nucleic acid-binding protein C1D [Nelumbo nucifera]|uniref:Nuclear nucleic acid-binding protein C1D n=1 Tax=Nelumbo nucifera TaxID=4432 RepID=A0A1U8ARD1_NELNU|nr:PREDICTED: nuclear nucleic acid-binding protein C1D [Nelumbo nucifera]XP_010265557.1 PREDICTED: nuclear nucleic acid-binding protein C1D [Nelumbo nucifera]